MHKDTRRLDLKPFGLALKRARIAKNMTQEAVGQMVDRTSRTIMHIENKGQHPSLNVFYQLVTYFDIPLRCRKYTLRIHLFLKMKTAA